MSILSDKHFRIALLISMLAHGVALSPLPAFRFNRPLPKKSKQMEIIYYKIKENPEPLQKITKTAVQEGPAKVANPVVKATVKSPEESAKATEDGDVLITKKNEFSQKREEAEAKRLEIKEIELGKLNVAKAIDVEAITPMDLPDSQKPLFLDYYRAIRERIKRTTDYPSGARRNLIEGSTHLSFVLSNDGSLKEVVVRKSSGNKLLDLSAAQSIRSASPFQPFPEGLRQPHLQLNIQISYELN